MELELEVGVEPEPEVVLVEMNQLPGYSGLTPYSDSPTPDSESELWRSPLPTHRRTRGA